eukprot:TRINITY_DN56325_c0_g1_i1.p1 TRINITY_DN56325_c0_g1~~TRINITY_DN56325_c0_g1_i1.p1  ORF type:complete len:695 (+),score=124.12 TRINITY_DN56325_c0_g1_i1:76-2160(+)
MKSNVRLALGFIYVLLLVQFSHTARNNETGRQRIETPRGGRQEGTSEQDIAAMLEQEITEQRQYLKELASREGKDAVPGNLIEWIGSVGDDLICGVEDFKENLKNLIVGEEKVRAMKGMDNYLQKAKLYLVGTHAKAQIEKIQFEQQEQEYDIKCTKETGVQSEVDLQVKKLVEDVFRAPDSDETQPFDPKDENVDFGTVMAKINALETKDIPFPSGTKTDGVCKDHVGCSQAEAAHAPHCNQFMYLCDLLQHQTANLGKPSSSEIDCDFLLATKNENENKHNKYTNSVKICLKGYALMAIYDGIVSKMRPVMKERNEAKMKAYKDVDQFEGEVEFAQNMQTSQTKTFQSLQETHSINEKRLKELNTHFKQNEDNIDKALEEMKNIAADLQTTHKKANAVDQVNLVQEAAIRVAQELRLYYTSTVRTHFSTFEAALKKKPALVDFDDLDVSNSLFEKCNTHGQTLRDLDQIPREDSDPKTTFASICNTESSVDEVKEQVREVMSQKSSLASRHFQALVNLQGATSDASAESINISNISTVTSMKDVEVIKYLSSWRSDDVVTMADTLKTTMEELKQHEREVKEQQSQLEQTLREKEISKKELLLQIREQEKTMDTSKVESEKAYELLEQLKADVKRQNEELTLAKERLKKAIEAVRVQRIKLKASIEFEHEDYFSPGPGTGSVSSFMERMVSFM